MRLLNAYLIASAVHLIWDEWFFPNTDSDVFNTIYMPHMCGIWKKCVYDRDAMTGRAIILNDGSMWFEPVELPSSSMNEL